MPAKYPKVASNPRKPIFMLVSMSVLVIIVGSLLAIGGIGPNSSGLKTKFFSFISRLSGSQLLIHADKTTLPADGKTSVEIKLEKIHIDETAVGRVTQGSGSLTTVPTQDGSQTFIFIAGTTTGETVLEFTAGNLTSELVLTLIDPNTPPAPALLGPANNITTGDATPETSGTGPASMKIQIMDNGVLNTATRTDDKGSFRVVLENPLSNGVHSLTAIAVNDLGVLSAPSPAVTIEVKSEPVTIDAANIRTSPRRLIASQSFGLFIPASTNTDKILIDFEGRQYTLLSRNGTSIFSGTLLAPANPGNYAASITLVDEGGNQTKPEQKLNFTVHAS